MQLATQTSAFVIALENIFDEKYFSETRFNLLKLEITTLLNAKGNRANFAKSFYFRVPWSWCET